MGYKPARRTRWTRGLLAQLYRIWASARAADLAKWMEHHQLTPVSREAGATSAEDLAMLAAGLMEEADATGQCAAVLALDLSKAYDGQPLELIEELVRTSGMHPAIGGPMLHMAQGWRRVKVLDIIGDAREPTSGLVPGCSLATFIMGTLLDRWRQGVRSEPPVLRVPRIIRTWVDDSTCGDIGAEQSAVTCIRGLRAMELLSASDLLQVNRVKSAVAATPASHREDMATLIQGRHEWAQGGILIVDEGEVGDDPTLWKSSKSGLKLERSWSKWQGTRHFSGQWQGRPLP